MPGLAESAGNLDLDESDPEHWIDRGGSANVLTPAVRSNYMPGLSGYNNGIVNIEKYEGEPVPPIASAISSRLRNSKERRAGNESGILL